MNFLLHFILISVLSFQANSSILTSTISPSSSLSLDCSCSSSFKSVFNTETIQEKLDKFVYTSLQNERKSFSTKVHIIANKVTFLDHLMIFTHTLLFHLQQNNRSNSDFALSYLTFILKLKDITSDLTLIKFLVDCLQHRMCPEIIELILSKQKRQIRELSFKKNEEIFSVALSSYFHHPYDSYDQIIKMFILFAQFGFDFSTFNTCKLSEFTASETNLDVLLHFAPLIEGLFSKPTGISEVLEIASFQFVLKDLFTVDLDEITILSENVFILFDKILSFLPDNMSTSQCYNLHRFIVQLGDNVGDSYEKAEVFLCSCCRNDLYFLLDRFLQIIPRVITTPHQLAHLLVQAQYSTETQHILLSHLPTEIITRESYISIIKPILEACELYSCNYPSASSSLSSSDSNSYDTVQS